MNAVAVMKLDSSLARNRAALAISSARAKRPIGTCTRRRAACSGSVGVQLSQQRRVDRPGAERVDPDAAAGELDAQLAGQREHASL